MEDLINRLIDNMERIELKQLVQAQAIEHLSDVISELKSKLKSLEESMCHSK